MSEPTAAERAADIVAAIKPIIDSRPVGGYFYHDFTVLIASHILVAEAAQRNRAVRLLIEAARTAEANNVLVKPSGLRHLAARIRTESHR
jgi:hypothetical protein